MPTPLHAKSTPAEIRARFDGDVERFSNLTTGQTATMDAPLAMALIAEAAVAATPTVRRVLDVGCGAGNNTLKLREVYGRDFAVDLLDLSPRMLKRARARVTAVVAAPAATIEGDFRTAALPAGSYDVILAAAVLHHLRDDADWTAAFQKLYGLLTPGGSLWITDLVTHESPAIRDLMWRRYGDYLEALAGPDYRDHVFAYIDREDSPRPITYQLALLREVGFDHVELLHMNTVFAAFGGLKRDEQQPATGR